MSKLADDPRIDPRIKRFFAAASSRGCAGNVQDRDQLLAEMQTPSAIKYAEDFKAFLDDMDREDLAPSAGLSFSIHEFESAPDRNIVKLHFIRPQIDRAIPCVYYIHGGAMATLSCFDGAYRAWGRLIAQEGVGVAMIDFRNCLRPSSIAEVAPYPAGLNDCISGLGWLRCHADQLKIDPEAIIVAGESGGGNLTLAIGLRLCHSKDRRLAKGLYAMCPYIAGQWPSPRFPSSIENNGILMDLHNNRAAMAYGIDAYNSRDPMAWPAFATKRDTEGFPPTVISLNECDPLRDEGIEFYRLLLRSGVQTRCRIAMGTVHGTELFIPCCPEISRNTALDIANFAIF